MLEGKVVIVTGGARGIGRHAATTFAREKAKVVVADVDKECAQKTAGELAKMTDASAIQVDVQQEDDVRKMVDRVLARHGQIDVLVNDAAIVPHFAWGVPR